MSDKPNRILIDATRPVEPNPKAIREAARDFAEHAARQQQEEADALGITRSELILRRIEQEKRRDTQAHYEATLSTYTYGRATFEDVLAADPTREATAEAARRAAEAEFRHRESEYAVPLWFVIPLALIATAAFLLCLWWMNTHWGPV